MPRGPDPQIPTIDILREFILSPDPAFVPSEIADALDVTTEGARGRMNTLVDEGLLAKKKPGERTVMYWITPEGKAHFAENASLP